MKQLKIEGETINLDPNTVIAQTLQIFDPGRIGSIVTNYTSSVRVPRTHRNDQILGFLANSKTKSDVPYTSLECYYIENGLPIIRNGRIVVNSATESDYNLSIYSGPWGFFERIQNKTLWDLDFVDINGPFTSPAADGYRNTTTGIVLSLVDDGILSSPSPPVIDYVGFGLRSPQIYYHTIVEKIFTTFGFEYEGDIFANAIYKKLVMPLALNYKDPNFHESKVFSAAASGDQIIINPTTEVNVIFNQNVKQGSDNFYDGTSEYVISNPDTPLGYFNIQFRADLTIIVTGGTVDLKIEATGFSPDEELNKGSGTYSLGFIGTTGHADGDVVKVTVVNNTGTPTVEIVSGVFYNYPWNGVEDENDETYVTSLITEYIYFQKLFEEVLLIDFLKEFSVRFNCQITQINNKLVINTLNKILDIRTGPDWTFKRNFGPNKIKYSFANYGSTNVIKTRIDTEYTPDLTSVSGDGSFDIPNENLKDNTTIYTSMFYASQMVNTFGVFMLQLNITRPVGSDGTEFVRYPGNRLFFVRDKYAFEPDVVYDSVDRDDYLVGYWFDPDQEYEMSFQFFIDQFHQKYIDRCLRKVRLVERVYNLSDLDIFAFNQQVPIWDDNERFLVTKISNRVSGKLAKVELLKIDPNPATFGEGETELSGELIDSMEVIGDDLPPELFIEMQLVETVTGNPTWTCEFDNTLDDKILTTIGDSSSDDNLLDPHVGALSVNADVLKTNNDGNGPDGFPVDTGWVEWLKNGVQMSTATFNSSSHSNAQGLSYVYLNVVAFDELLVIVHEDGTSP